CFMRFEVEVLRVPITARSSLLRQFLATQFTEAKLSPSEECRKLGDSSTQLFKRPAAHSHMPQFSARPRRLPIQLQMRVRHPQYLFCLWQFTDQVDHRRTSNRFRCTQR